MANICPVCDKGIGAAYKEEIQGVSIHSYCEPIFLSEPEKFGGKKLKVGEEGEVTNQPPIKEGIEFFGNYLEEEEAEKQKIEEYSKLQKEIKDKSVYVRGFDMPFGEMITFMVKWALASIPAFIILFIIFGILFLIFGSIFF